MPSRGSRGEGAEPSEPSRVTEPRGAGRRDHAEDAEPKEQGPGSLAPRTSALGLSARKHRVLWAARQRLIARKGREAAELQGRQSARAVEDRSD